ncbi:MAG: helix-turn-helix domain-containing protein [[Lactobacillus] timonensis]|jgi:putative transcriptional regulator|uniref:helix-turn-helix transcriptional regulator n=1 Tax=[Lactobacillus] timonensis TaxID=1970790 RepID=UPI00235402A2|nr:helix-turn-helix transcriptional regulator [[Lactobacillus] timonensis]MCI1925647.1 helix-turn-helix domain-containing protein [[Lactobacillus] timonensis]MCI1957008.1 helix-turn-helix domain-containing protein [[Lactobacillus] timonensis]MCI1970037.1 helix-turn-helix domain-containing protein [[Lactobacillus] timonensis]MCI2006198.1 helix-turn-helix domain-containing protein [[Lactobacillus] timonensis]
MKRELRSLRAGAGLTQQQLADKLGVSHISVSRWETGKAIPSPKYIKQMADMFGVAGKDIFFNLITTKVIN